MHHSLQLINVDLPIPVPIEPIERLHHFLLAVSFGHHRKELVKVDGAIAIHINLFDYTLQLHFGKATP